MPTLDKMLEIGLYINDLSMHDSSREMVLAGTQQAAEFKIALEQVCTFVKISQAGQGSITTLEA